MSCSKEMRIPQKWSKYHNDILKEAVNKELFTEDECMNWMIACGVSDKSRIRKYIESVRPYHFMRCMAVFIPGNPLCTDVMTTYMYYLAALYHVDDCLETYSSSELHEACEAYAKLDKHIWEQYPQLPTIPEMKQYLKKEVKVDEKLIPLLVIFVDGVNRITNTLLQHGQFTEADVKNFRKRVSIGNAIGLEAAKAESTPSVTANSTYSEILWRRIECSGSMFFLPVLEVMADSIGKVREHVTCITEMYLLSSLFLTLINDLYSSNKETIEEIDGDDSIVLSMIANKDAIHVLDAAEKITPFINAIIKVMYQKSEKVKREHSHNPELHKLLDYIGMATIGWYFIHDRCLPRYMNTSCRISLVEVGEKGLEQWTEDTDQMSFSDEMGLSIENFLYNSNARAKTMIDAHCGRISPRGHFIPV